jgi:hypothetical protein
VYPIVLARCWSLDDGTACHLSKVGERTWELRVSRGHRLLTVEVFRDLRIAVATAAAWRGQYAAEAESA